MINALPYYGTSQITVLAIMMKFGAIVLDTDVLSQFAKSEPKPLVRDFIENTPIDKMAIPFPVLVEVFKGIEIRSRTSPQRAAWLRQWVNLMLATDMLFLPANEKTSVIYAKLIAMPELRGLWMINGKNRDKFPGQDLMVAATAIAYQLPIATMNGKDFQLIDNKMQLPGVLDLHVGCWLCNSMTPFAEASNPDVHLIQKFA